MTRRLFASYLTITLFVLVVLAVPLGLTFADRERTALLADIERDAHVVASRSEDRLQTGSGSLPTEMVASYADRTGARVVVVDKNGQSVVDTDAAADATPQDFSNRPEIAQALAGESSIGNRSSTTLGHRIFFVAVPIASANGVFGAVRITYPASELDGRVADNWRRLIILSVVVIVAVILIGTVTARGVTGPIHELRNAAIRLASGDLAARVPASRGPAELREAANTFNSMAARIQQLVEGQRWFVAAASHELRTPLTALRLRLETLEPTIGPEHIDEFEAALTETKRFSSLVEGLLALARAEGEEATPIPVDVAAIVRERVDMWSPLADEVSVRLETDLDEPVVGLALPTALPQILDNLIANSMDVMPSGGRIVIEVGATSTAARIIVADNGPGLDPASWNTAFDRFWRATDAPSGGSGLGLSLVRQLARASGGDAGAVDHSLGGFAVEVLLPLAPVGASPASPESRGR